MTAEELLARLRAEGISLRLAGMKLMVSPSYRLTESSAQLIRDFREDLIEVLLPPIPEGCIVLVTAGNGETAVVPLETWQRWANDSKVLG